jgi:hypothetical protein
MNIKINDRVRVTVDSEPYFRKGDTGIVEAFSQEDDGVTVFFTTQATPHQDGRWFVAFDDLQVIGGLYPPTFYCVPL